jgi:hypothetical protein
MTAYPAGFIHTECYSSGGQNKTNRTIQYVGNTVIMYFSIFSQLYCIFENKNTLRVKMQFTGIDFYRLTLCLSSLYLKRIGSVIKIHSPSMPMYPFLFLQRLLIQFSSLVIIILCHGNKTTIKLQSL